MSLDGLFKRTVYYANDLIHGSTIINMVRDSQRVQNDHQYGQQWQAQRTREILDWAASHTEFYKDYQGKELKEFPVVNKLILTQNHEKNVVSPSLIPWQKGPVFIQRTSGSTGVPLEVPMDTRKRQRRVADLKYFNGTVGFKSHEKLGQCRIWTKWHSKNKKQIFWENIIPINVAKLDAAGMEEFVRTIRDEKLFALRAYASTYDFLVDYIKSGKVDIRDLETLKICISGAEALNPVTREEMMRLTGIPIVEAYADEEAGTLAHQRIGDVNYYLNHTCYYIEWLKLDSDEPAEYGELARIVLTDFYNYAFPMIRYDTGDTAVFAPGNEQSHGWPYISKLYGRRMDTIYNTKGEPMHPMNFGRTLKNFKTILQWQFIQKGEKEYCVKVQVANDSELDAVIREVLSIVGDDAKVTVEQVDTIPVLTSGKRKPVVCEWKR
ncbi:MAG: hypothetical protein SPD95_03600 [Candidatus Faecousia sp.]|nr:hypothetical protein [Candidatus Faecousia sp.]